MAGKTGRANRVARQIHRELAEIFADDMGDPRFKGLTVTGVELSRDLGQAKIRFFSSREDPRATELEPALDRAEGFFRAALAERLPLRRIPRLRFQFDRGPQNIERIDSLLQRISKRRKALGLLACVSFGLSGSIIAAADPQALERHEASFSAMGTRFRVAAYGEKRGFVASVVAAAFEQVRRGELMLSHYRPESELSLINRHAAEGPWKVSEPMLDLLAWCLDQSRLSEGGFDMTVGPLMRVWGFFRDAGRIPSAAEISRALAVVGYQYVELDRRRRTVRFLREGVELDPGGMGKGYAVDLMADVMREAGLERFFISAGGSSLYAGDAPPSDERGWRVSIRGGEKDAATVEKLYLTQESLSTSGSYEKFFKIDGKLYNHLMSPRTGRPVEGMISVSVTAPTTLESEVWATALFVNGADWTRRNKPSGLRVFVCPQDRPCEWIVESADSDGTHEKQGNYSSVTVSQ